MYRNCKCSRSFQGFKKEVPQNEHNKSENCTYEMKYFNRQSNLQFLRKSGSYSVIPTCQLTFSSSRLAAPPFVRSSLFVLCCSADSFLTDCLTGEISVTGRFLGARLVKVKLVLNAHPSSGICLLAAHCSDDEDEELDSSDEDWTCLSLHPFLP